MKISKLFHWLYATLMFLPIIFFVPSCLYYGFNEHATNTETTTINYKYESNEVNTLDDLVVGNIYYVDELVLSSDAQDFYFEVIDVKQISFDTSTWNYIDLETNIYGNTIISLDTNLLNINVKNNGLNSVLQYDLNDSDLTLTDLIFSCDNTTNLTTLRDLYLAWGNLPQYTDYNVIESVSVNTDDTITDKVAYAWESIWNLPLFAWTHNSFVAAPFSYITGLFGVGSDNTLNYVFAYFVSISICWLVFDLVMYVPNLAHRWLDRSSLE